MSYWNLKQTSVWTGMCETMTITTSTFAPVLCIYPLQLFIWSTNLYFFSLFTCSVIYLRLLSSAAEMTQIPHRGREHFIWSNAPHLFQLTFPLAWFTCNCFMSHVRSPQWRVCERCLYRHLIALIMFNPEQLKHDNCNHMTANSNYTHLIGASSGPRHGYLNC